MNVSIDVPENLTELWRLADELAKDTNGDPDGALDDASLLLIRPPINWDYFCTPKNSITFANTGAMESTSGSYGWRIP